MVFGTLGRFPTCREFSTIDQVCEAIVDHLKITDKDDAYIFVFYGNRLLMSSSTDPAMTPVIETLDGHVRPLYGASILDRENEATLLGKPYQLRQDNTDPEESGSIQGFDEDDFLL